MKKLAGSVRFYKQKTKKTEPNRNRQKTEKKPSQNRENQAKTGKTEPNRTETGWFDPVSVFFQKKNFSLVIFF